jgi:hypothetical protein
VNSTQQSNVVIKGKNIENNNSRYYFELPKIRNELINNVFLFDIKQSENHENYDKNIEINLKTLKNIDNALFFISNEEKTEKNLKNFNNFFSIYFNHNPFNIKLFLQIIHFQNNLENLKLNFIINNIDNRNNNNNNKIDRLILEKQLTMLDQFIKNYKNKKNINNKDLNLTNNLTSLYLTYFEFYSKFEFNFKEIIKKNNDIISLNPTSIEFIYYNFVQKFAMTTFSINNIDNLRNEYKKNFQVFIENIKNLYFINNFLPTINNNNNNNNTNNNINLSEDLPYYLKEKLNSFEIDKLFFLLQFETMVGNTEKTFAIAQVPFFCCFII